MPVSAGLFDWFKDLFTTKDASDLRGELSTLISGGSSAYVSCGNGIIDYGEVCDGNNLNGKTCESLGYDAGTLYCCSNCSNFRLSNCYNITRSCNDHDSYAGDEQYYIASNTSFGSCYYYGPPCPGEPGPGPSCGGGLGADSCQDDYTLTEGICTGDTGSTVSYDCPDGCSNGACIQTPIGTCTSSEIGDTRCRYFGVSKGGPSVWIQECKSNLAWTNTAECPEGCEDGVCLGSPIACYNNDDCPPVYGERYCNGSRSCQTVTFYICSNPGTSDSECISNAGALGCTNCPYGCDENEGICIDVPLSCGDGTCTYGDDIDIQELETITFVYRGIDYSVSLLSVSSTSLVIEVNGVRRDITERRRAIISGLPVYVMDIFYSTQIGAVNYAILYLGENEQSCPEDCFPQLEHVYMILRDFGAITYNVGSLEEGPDADTIDVIKDIFSGFINGAFARYTIHNTDYDPDMMVSVAEFNHKLTFEEFDNNFVSKFGDECKFDYDESPIGEQGSQVLVIDCDNQISVTWTSNGKFVLIYVEDLRSVMDYSDPQNEEDFIDFIMAYLEKHPSTLIPDTATCSVIGLRSDGRYCSLDQVWEKQKSTDAFCENNFECYSNLCFERRCVSADLVRRIITWFRILFGLCESHAYYTCDDGDIYWFDDCGRREEIKEDCGHDCRNGICYGQIAINTDNARNARVTFSSERVNEKRTFSYAHDQDTSEYSATPILADRANKTMKVIENSPIKINEYTIISSAGYDGRIIKLTSVPTGALQSTSTIQFIDALTGDNLFSGSGLFVGLDGQATTNIDGQPYYFKVNNQTADSTVQVTRGLGAGFGNPGAQTVVFPRIKLKDNGWMAFLTDVTIDDGTEILLPHSSEEVPAKGVVIDVDVSQTITMDGITWNVVEGGPNKSRIIDIREPYCNFHYLTGPAILFIESTGDFICTPWR